MAGEPITYTLTITNSGSLTVTNLLITDAIPAGAGYITGGVRMDGGVGGTNVVSWTVPALAADASTQVSFVVTATETITNRDYAVSADGGLWAEGQEMVTTYLTVTAPITRDWRLIATLVSPPVVGEHGMAYLPSSPEGGRIVLYGGNATGWPYENTTWELSGTTWLSNTTSSTPGARYGAQMAYVSPPMGETGGEQLMLFGGSDETDTALNQTWTYSGTDWTRVTISGTVPASRTYHSLAANPISGTVYLFGGNDRETYYNDLWRYENGAWNEISIIGDKPSARTLAAMTYAISNPQSPISNQLLLFGGRSVTGTLLADLWAFDLSTASWQLLDDGGGGGPPARQAHSLTCDPATGKVILIGGTTDEGDTVLGDTWHYGEGWTEANPATTLPPRAYHQVVSTPAGIVLFSDGEVWRYE
jgi:uncharacterized repeat protein (TIGR01451 family)